MGFRSLDWMSPESTVLKQLTQVISRPVNEKYKVYKHGKDELHGPPVVALINTEPLELLCLQPSEPITSESVENYCLGSVPYI